MSSEHFQKPYKQRFKGVETFLRRVAFNLGNTASQTEVKIISCIPIDVTDLQQKIINLEKQLHETQQQAATKDEKVHEKPKEKPSATVNTALYGSSFTKQSSAVSYCSNKPIANIKSGPVATCEVCSSRAKKSNVSFIFPTLSARDTEQGCSYSRRKDCNENTAAIERCKNIFRKRKRKKSYKGNNKIKTHLVYYAHQTADNPFKINERPVKYNEILSNNDELCISHLNNVIRRQYDPNEVVEEFSDTSHISRPICRDGNKYGHFNHYGSDVCSCCHDKFQNIDNYMTKTDYDSILTKLHNSLDNTKVYYDSNHYDIIPVKENSNKIIKNNNDLKKENKMNVEMKCWPEHLRTKHRYHPFIVNYQTEIPAKQRPKKPQAVLPIKNKNIQQKMIRNRDKIMKSDRQTVIETSKSCCIDCSDVYPKRYTQQAESRKNEILKTMLQKNETVATDNVDTKLQVNNQSTQLEVNTTEDARDLTLNQIKTILQSVLEEVKTSAKLNNADGVAKKDAIVQNGTSQNSVPGASTLLHSYTYNNSYNTNSYLPSCSKQIPNGPFCLASVPYQPIKCLQNFPVFIQPTSGRHLCACYYRKSSYKPQNKQGTTAGTNTEKDIEKSNSKETEKLIKEIYKSMALNMDFPSKDSSTSEYNDLKSENISTNTMEDKSNKVSNKRDNKVEAMVSPIQSIMNQNKLECTSVKTQSENKKQAIDSYFNKAEPTGNMNKDKCVNRLELHSIRSSDTIVEDEEETDGFSDESDETVILEEELKQKSKPKKGFFNRMFNSVKLFKKKKQTREEIEASDSEDYETIYSERSAKVPPRSYKENQAINYTNVTKYSPDDGNRVRRSPYLEQEYRRQWNEKLSFREHESKCSSERPIPRHSGSRPTRPIYWNNYEARSAIVDHKLPNQCKTIDVTKNGHETIQRNEFVQDNGNKERLGWLKKHKLGIHCGEQWKKFILEN